MSLISAGEFELPRVTQTLQSLEDGGAVRSVRGLAQHRGRRVKIYQLTTEGEKLVRHVRAGRGRIS